MATSKHAQQPDDISQYLLSAGLQEVFLHLGFVATVRSVDETGVNVVLPCGEIRRISFQLEMPTPDAIERLKRWSKLLRRCEQKSIWIRFLGVKHVQQHQWSLSNDSVLLEQCMILHSQDSKRAMKIFETFCGSFGGWSRAADWLGKSQFEVVGAGDWDEHAVATWNENASYRHGDATVKACQLNFADVDSWAHVVSSGAEVLSMSSSCKSFSFAGRQQGWNAIDGKHLAMSLAFAALHGFRHIALENVAPLIEGKFRQQLEDVLSHYHFRIIFETVFNIQNSHPVDRNRAIFLISSVASDRRLHELESQVHHFFTGDPVSLWLSGRWMDIPEPIRQDVTIPPCVEQEFRKYVRLPSFMKSRTFCNASDAVIECRRIRSNGLIASGTIVASYGNQHALSDNGIILGSLRWDGKGWRYLHAIEALLALGVTGPVVLSRGQRESMYGTGNAISESHALVGLVALKYLLDPACTFDLPMLLQAHLDQCITADHASLSWDHQKILLRNTYVVDGNVNHRDDPHLKTRRLDVCLVEDVEHVQDDNQCEAFDELPFALSWTGCRINMYDTKNIRTFLIQGQRLTDFSWKAESGRVWDQKMSLYGIRQLHTCCDIGFSTVPAGYVRVICVGDDSLRWDDMRFTEGSTVEDLRRAEQFLVGPSTRIQNPHDSTGVEISGENLVASQQILTFYWETTGSSVFVDVTQDECITRMKREQGDRLFQFLQLSQGDWIEDEGGFVLPLDFTVMHPMKIFVKKKPLEISPTLPYVVQTCSDIPSVFGIVKDSTTSFEEKLVQKFEIGDEVNRNFAAQRWKTLSEKHMMMADDEMAFMLGYIEDSSQLGFAGVFSWDAECKVLIRLDQSTSQTNENQKRNEIGAIIVDNHWIPFLCSGKNDVSSVWEYMNSEPIDDGILQALCRNICGHERFCPHFVEGSSQYGWCGFAAVEFLARKLAIKPLMVNERDQKMKSERLKQNIDPQIFESIWSLYDRCPYKIWTLSLTLRQDFILSQIESPTVPIVHAAGNDESAILKIRGKLASTLIARGHQASEAIGVAEALTKVSSVEIKQLANQKEDQIYNGILERCEKQGIEISRSIQVAAAAKLQKFFRSKRQQRKIQQSRFSLHDVAFHGSTFTSPSGEPTPVQSQWTIMTRGIGIADPNEVQDVADSGRLVTTDHCAAITLTAIQVKAPIISEQVTVQVTDGFGNLALIRVYVTQFGTKKIMKQPTKDAEVELTPSGIVAMTVYQHLVDDGFWSSMMKGPARAILESLECDKEMKINHIYSRRWTKNGKIVDKQEAEIFSMLCVVPKADVKKWLVKSGVSRQPIFTTSKRKDGETPQEAHRIIWTGRSLKDSILQMSVVPDHAGIAFKQPSSFGIRVQAQRFASAWQEIKGDKAVPCQVSSKYKYMIAGVPPGITGTTLEAWSSSLNWPFRVLKRFADGRFLVGSDVMKPDQHLSLNGQEMLITEHRDTKPQQKTLIAGKLQRNVQSNGGDGWEEDDPWKHAHAKQHVPMQRLSDPWAKWKGSNASDDSMEIQSTEPSEQILKGQSERITAMEEKMQMLEVKMQEGQACNTAKFDKLQSDISGIEQSLKGSLKEALTQQSEQLLATFETLLKRSPRTKFTERSERSRSPSKAGM